MAKKFLWSKKYAGIAKQEECNIVKCFDGLADSRRIQHFRKLDEFFFFD